jgi:hypothetical protein
MRRFNDFLSFLWFTEDMSMIVLIVIATTAGLIQLRALRARVLKLRAIRIRVRRSR